METVSRYVVDGWAIAADPHTPIGSLAALTAETACVPFASRAHLAHLADLAQEELKLRTDHV